MIMKRGFLNSKKAKDQAALHDNGAVNHKAVTTKVTTVRATATEHYVVYLFPSPELTQSKERSSACIFRPSTCEKITRTPGFYTPPPPLNPTSVVFTKNVPNMGVGLFCKSSVEVRQEIFSERPLLIYPLAYWMPAVFHNLSEEEKIKTRNVTYEMMLQRALSEMTKEDADAYMSLANCHPDRPPLYGIAKTNVFATDADLEEGTQEKAPYGLVGKLASRINHSCMPNVRMRFDIATFSLRIVAIRDIKAGEPLFYPYCDLHQPVKERRRLLAVVYGFECQCQACVKATPESDRLREEMNHRIQKIIDEKEKMFADPEFSIRSLDPLLELEKGIVKEGLDFGDMFSSLISIILQASAKLKIHPKPEHIEYFYKVTK